MQRPFGSQQLLKWLNQVSPRRAASGEDFGLQDGAFMVMLNDLIAQRPDAVMGWLEAELDAQEFVANPANADAIAAMAEAQTEKIDQSVLKASPLRLTDVRHN